MALTTNDSNALRGAIPDPTAATNVIALLNAPTSSSSSSGIGYTTGAGGTVTQATSITTGVTLNKVCGTITTVSSTLAAAAEAAFTVTNSSVAATDGVFVWIKSTSSAGTPVVFVTAVAAGSFAITISNLHASAALDNTLDIGFTVIKAVAA